MLIQALAKFLLLISLVASFSVSAAERVGEVTLLIGKAALSGADKQVRPLERGAAIFVGDRIETEAGGHVHIRFVDGGVISIRPGSRFLIEDYRRDGAEPQKGAIRFQLQEGVVRSITGAWGEAAKDRFRLNTPIAAIGIKGTDFTVSATPGQTLAAVQRGAIVVAPFGPGCQSSALGPCEGEAARLLSAEMGGVMLELRHQKGPPRIVPVKDAGMMERLSSNVERSQDKSPPESKNETEVVAEGQAARLVRGQNLAPPLSGPPKLVWGRWGGAWEGDTLSLSYAEMLKKNWELTVGGWQYVLARDNEPPFQYTQAISQQGRVGFALQSAQAHLLGAGGPQAAAVQGGWLSIDFAARQFSTGLNLQHPDTGNVALKYSGEIRQNGTFVGLQEAGRVAGALSNDTREAGYFFEHSVPQGTFSGITLWKR